MACATLVTDPTVRQREDFYQVVDRLPVTMPPWEVLQHYRPQDVARCWGPKEVLPHCPPDVALQRFRPAERLADLSSEERILALPDDVLRGFSAAYLDTLPERIRQAGCRPSRAVAGSGCEVRGARARA